MLGKQLIVHELVEEFMNATGQTVVDATLSDFMDWLDTAYSRLLTPRAPDPAATEAIVQDIMTEAETYLASEDYDDFERFLHERLGG